MYAGLSQTCQSFSMMAGIVEEFVFYGTLRNTGKFKKALLF